MDASALLAYLRDEPGGEVVGRALESGAFLSAVNWAEVLSKLAEGGQDPEDAARALADAGILGEGLILRPPTRRRPSRSRGYVPPPAKRGSRWPTGPVWLWRYPLACRLSPPTGPGRAWVHGSS